MTRKGCPRACLLTPPAPGFQKILFPEVERVLGFEPRPTGWKPDTLPLRHTLKVEPTAGLEPANFFLTKEVPYQLGHVGVGDRPSYSGCLSGLWGLPGRTFRSRPTTITSVDPCFSRFFAEMEPEVGVEPTTACLRNMCSTDELLGRSGWEGRT